MLDEITASNLGLIAAADLTIADGLTVISGETGTGKTLMLGALRLLRGEKAGRNYIGPASGTCDVAARFVDSDGLESVVRRRLDGSRSRAYVDDTAATVGALADATKDRIAIVGQHDQHTITSSSGVRSLVDRLLTEEGRAAKDAYAEAWIALSEVSKEADQRNLDPKSLERERDMLEYQIDEITAAGLVAGEESDLHERVRKLRNADGLQHEIDQILRMAGDGEAGSRLDTAIAAARRASRLDTTMEAILARLESLSTDLSELAGDVAVYAAGLESDPTVLDEVEHRLSIIGALQRKYGDTVADILRYADDAAAKRADLVETLGRAATLEERLSTAASAAATAGTRLRTARQEAATVLAAEAAVHLRELGFAHPVIDIAVEEARPAGPGADRLTVRFASDSSLDPGAVGDIASGGELSRLVLALTLASGAHEAAVVAFDEIDAGIGGSTALAMGRKLAALAKHRQVICVTHLPQVAAFGDAHYTVDRNGSTASIRRVEGDARLAELTRMLSGMSDSAKGRQHAQELLELARS